MKPLKHPLKNAKKNLRKSLQEYDHECLVEGLVTVFCSEHNLGPYSEQGSRNLTHQEQQRAANFLNTVAVLLMKEAWRLGRSVSL